MSNPNYQTPDLTAFAIEQRLKRDWTAQYTKASALLACIHDKDLKFQKGYTVSGTKAIVPTIYAGSGLDKTNMGVADNAQIPSAWPTFRATTGFTQLQFEYSHLVSNMTILSTEKKFAANGARGNLIEGKVSQLMSDFKSGISEMISGNQADSRTSLVGVDYVIATANTYGGVDRTQAGGAWARGKLDTTGTTIGFVPINNMYDSIMTEADIGLDAEAPDLLLLTNIGGTNLYGRFRELIAPSERFENNDFKVKYGISHFMYMGMKCVMQNRGTGGQFKMLTTSTWIYGGEETPHELQAQRIIGSSAEERMFEIYNFLGCDKPNANGRGTGFTG